MKPFPSSFLPPVPGLKVHDASDDKKLKLSFSPPTPPSLHFNTRQPETAVLLMSTKDALRHGNKLRKGMMPTAKASMFN